MYSYTATHHFSPKTRYQPLTDLIPFIDQTLSDQDAVSKMEKKELTAFKDKLLQCMEVYYKLVGIDEKVIEGKGRVEPQGVLVRYTESLIGYFQELERKVPSSIENDGLKYSGVNTIKIRYKYTDSVIKKLVKLGLNNPKLLDDPLQIFLKGGALHDLIGMLFVCSYPYEKEWVARTLYNFFEYDNRTDDHLMYGFYKVEKKSGYSGLHCDHTFFNPRFDADILGKSHTLPSDANTIFTLLNSKDSSTDVLRKLKHFFNIEIQLHTTFESLWSSMEHTNNYNIQAKGTGRNAKITVQWKMLSDAMKNIEQQFERLQIDTEQARFETLHHTGYIPVKNLLNKLGSDTHSLYIASMKKVEDLEDDLKSHEISRQDYVHQLQIEANAIDTFALKQSDMTVQTIFKMQSAFIYYGLANQRAYFNADDIQQFVEKSLQCYEDISTVLENNANIYKADLLHIVTIIRYLYLTQKYGLGLMNPPKETFTDENVSVAVYEKRLSFFMRGLSLFNRLEDEDKNYFKNDSANALKVIYYYDVLARDWELFSKKSDATHCVEISKDIESFREHFINHALVEQFNTQLESNKIKNIGFVVNFYATLVWHGLLRPMYALKQIIKYSAYDKIQASDLFYYELSAYRFVLYPNETALECSADTISNEHSKNYHQQNMIQLLFRIRRSEPVNKFNKARLHFEQLTQTEFKLDHFSDMLSKEKE